MKNKLKPLRLPGQSLDEQSHYLQRFIDGLTLLGWVVGIEAFFEVLRWRFPWPARLLPPLAVVAILVPGCYLTVKQLQKRLRNMQLGRDGERFVGQTLNELRAKGFFIFHDVLGETFNIDHVIVSQHGIFAVETKTWSKLPREMVSFDGEKVTVSGKRPDRDAARQAKAGSDWLRRELQAVTKTSLKVTPVVVFPGWWVDERHNSERIWVMNPDGLAQKISRQPLVLTDEDVQSVSAYISLLTRISN